MPYSTLRRFPLIETTSPQDMRDALTRACGIRRFDLPRGPEGFSAVAHKVTLRSVTIGYCGYGAETVIGFPEADYVRQQVGLSGTGTAMVGGKEIPLGADRTWITPANVPSTMHYHPGFEQIVLRLDPNSVQQKLAAILGFHPGSAPVFYPAAEFRDPGTQRLRRLVLFVCGELGCGDAALPQPILDELEQSLIAAFLTCNRHSYSHLLAQPQAPVAPWQVKVIEEYIEANWSEAITVERLSAVSGASARTIFHSFQRARGYSPMDFVKQVRLMRAKHMLEAAEPGATVTGIALRCRFNNMGHFARDYRTAFGELPSDTLNRARGAQLTRRFA